MTTLVSEIEPVRTKSAGQVLRWVGVGVASLLALSVVGGALAGVLVQLSFGKGAAPERVALAMRFYDLLLVTPLAIGLAVAIAVGIPAARALQARKTRPGRDGSLTLRKDGGVLALSVVCGWLLATVSWSLSGKLVPGTSMQTAHLAGGADTATLDHDFYAPLVRGTEGWSIAQTMGLSLALLVIAVVVAWRAAPNEGRPAIVRAIRAAAVLTVVSGGLFAWNAVQAYQDMGMKAGG